MKDGHGSHPGALPWGSFASTPLQTSLSGRERCLGNPWHASRCKTCIHLHVETGDIKVSMSATPLYTFMCRWLLHLNAHILDKYPLQHVPNDDWYSVLEPQCDIHPQCAIHPECACQTRWMGYTPVPASQESLHSVGPRKPALLGASFRGKIDDRYQCSDSRYPWEDSRYSW